MANTVLGKNATSAAAVSGTVGMLSMATFERNALRHNDTPLPIARDSHSLARMIRTFVALSVMLLGVAATGCRRGRSASLGMSDTTFVATLSDLRRIETDTSLDITMRDSTRHMILRRHKVTAEQLEKAARALAQSPARASDIWRSVESVQRATPAKSGMLKPGAAPGNNHPVPHI
jgi:hypothetical protein